MRLRRLGEGFHLGIDRMLGLLAQREHACLIRIAGEGSGERLAQLRNERGQRIAKFSARAGGQGQRHRPVGMTEIIEIEPVGRNRPLFHRRFEISERRPHPRRAVFTDHKDIEAKRIDRETEIERLARPRMACQVEDAGAHDRRRREARNARRIGLQLGRAHDSSLISSREG